MSEQDFMCMRRVRQVKHTTNFAGDCVDWCRACDGNTRDGWNPDGTPLEQLSEVTVERDNARRELDKARNRAAALLAERCAVEAERDALKRRVVELEDAHTITTKASQDRRIARIRELEALVDDATARPGDHI